MAISCSFRVYHVPHVYSYLLRSPSKSQASSPNSCSTIITPPLLLTFWFMKDRINFSMIVNHQPERVSLMLWRHLTFVLTIYFGISYPRFCFHELILCFCSTIRDRRHLHEREFQLIIWFRMIRFSRKRLMVKEDVDCRRSNTKYSLLHEQILKSMSTLWFDWIVTIQKAQIPFQLCSSLSTTKKSPSSLNYRVLHRRLKTEISIFMCILFICTLVHI